MDPNDPIDTASAVQALLDSLRASTALQQTITASAAHDHAGSYGDASPATSNALDTPVSQPQREDNGVSSSRPSATTPAASVADLLSQLQATSSLARSGVPSVGSSPDRYEYPPNIPSGPAQATPSQPAAPVLDLRSCSFQQAFPYLTRLSEDQKFLAAARSLKQEQVLLEQKLLEERQAVQKQHEEKVKAAKIKANMIGAGLTQYEADSMTDSFRRDLQKFDAERALPAWDGLIAKQQTTLESFGVPAMFLSTEPADRERQQRVMQVIDNFLV